MRGRRRFEGEEEDQDAGLEVDGRCDTNVVLQNVVVLLLCVKCVCMWKASLHLHYNVPMYSIVV